VGLPSKCSLQPLSIALSCMACMDGRMAQHAAAPALATSTVALGGRMERAGVGMGGHRNTPAWGHFCYQSVWSAFPHLIPKASLRLQRCGGPQPLGKELGV
jgi:hypothetical protein